MAKIRIGLGSEFNLNNSNLGLGVTNPQVRLDVDGTVKSKDFEVTGVTSFTAYEGFLRSDHQIDGDLTLNTGQGLNASLSGEIIVKDGVTVTVGAVGLGTTEVGIGTDNSVGVGTTTNQKRTTNIDSNALNLAGGSEIECLKIYNTFTPPAGGTNERPEAPKPGELYYNYDFKTIEFHDGYGWRQVDNTTRSGRGVFGGGLTPHPASTYLSMIDYVQIPTLGNAVHFGDLSAARRRVGGLSSETRGVFIRGTNSSNTRLNTMEYITIASGGNAITFGDGGVTGSTIGDGDGSCSSSSTRGIQAGGGSPGNHNIITYIQINTTGNALDFGDLTEIKHQIASFSSPVRAIHYSGYVSSGSFAPSVDTHLIASKGDAVDFAEPLIPRYGSNALSNSTRGIICTGQPQGAPGTSSYNGYMTAMNTSSQGNEVFFGTMGDKRAGQSATSTQTRGVFAGGYGTGSGEDGISNTIDYVTINSLGDSIDFGDLTLARSIYNGISDSHGGLGGF